MLANLSIDLDNLWAYHRAAEIDGWQDYPSYLPLVVPRIIKHLALSNLTATIFVVGRDLEDRRNVGAIRQFQHAGHEFANHSYEHEPWLHIFDNERLHREIVGTGDRIKSEFGKTPIGFRGPGFSDSAEVRRILVENGYGYCASSFPSCVGPMARAFYLLKTGLRKKKSTHGQMFGRLSDVLKSNRPHSLRETDHKLWMFPVTVQPMTRLPFHFTYLFYLSQFSPALARMYFRVSLSLCGRFRVSPSFLLHPTDFLNQFEEPSLSFFPGMKLGSDVKQYQLRWFLDYISLRFDVVTMNEHYSILSGQDTDGQGRSSNSEVSNVHPKR